MKTLVVLCAAVLTCLAFGGCTTTRNESVAAVPEVSVSERGEEKPGKARPAAPVEGSQLDDLEMETFEKKLAELREKRKRAAAENADISDLVKKAQLAVKEVKKGDAAFEKGKLDEAIKHYEAALELTPNAPKFRFAYAQLLYWKALSYDQKASKENMRQAIIYYNKSLRELIRCDFDWNQAVESVPFAMGLVYFMLMKYDEAICCFERVLESDQVSDEYREKVANAIKLLKEHQEREENEKK